MEMINKVNCQISNVDDGQKTVDTFLELFTYLILYYQDHNIKQGKIFTYNIYTYFKMLINYTDGKNKEENDG
jgi:hypothetical protein